MARALVSPSESIDCRTDHLGTDIVIEDDPRCLPPPTGDIVVWPDHWPAFRLFSSLLTQWRMGPSGPVGLDYGVIDTTAQRLGIARRTARRAFEPLQVMEAEALSVIADRTEQAMKAQR